MRSIDLRTRSGRESECLAQIQKAGGFSTFWASEFMTRAHALYRLQESGRIKVHNGQFPWHYARIVKQGKKSKAA